MIGRLRPTIPQIQHSACNSYGDVRCGCYSWSNGYHEFNSRYYNATIYNNANVARTSSPPGLSQSDFPIKSKYEGYTNWNATIFKDNFELDTDYYNYPVVKGTKYFASPDAFYIKNVRSSTGDGKYSNGDEVYLEVTFNKPFKVTGSGTPTIALIQMLLQWQIMLGPHSFDYLLDDFFIYSRGKRHQP